MGYHPHQLRASWAVMEELHRSGLVRSIGLSNIGVNRLRALLSTPDLRVPPAVVQVEHHPYLSNAELLALAASRSPPIRVTAYCSLGSATRPQKYRHDSSPVLLDEPVLRSIGAAHGTTPAAVALAWAVRHDVAVIPKSSQPDRVQANLHSTLVLAPLLSKSEIAALDGLERNHRFLDDGWLGYAWRPGQTLTELLDDPPPGSGLSIPLILAVITVICRPGAARVFAGFSNTDATKSERAGGSIQVPQKEDKIPRRRCSSATGLHASWRWQGESRHRSQAAAAAPQCRSEERTNEAINRSL
ncbi:MAG: hypothetical protein SGPRY_010106 [Prymnesium sp.]